MSRLSLPKEAYIALCQAVLYRDRWRCRFCAKRNTLHVHHIVYRSAGGDDVESNLITLCAKHHEQVHSSKIEILPNTDGTVIFKVLAA